MKQTISRLVLLAAAFGVLAGLANADKNGPVIIKSGPIKPTSGDDPGTLKPVLGLRLMNPDKGPFAPNAVSMTFDLLTDLRDAHGKAIRYQLKGEARTNPGKMSVWRIEKKLDGLTLTVDGRKADFVRLPSSVDAGKLMVTVYSSPFDAKANPYGRWTVAWEGGGNSPLAKEDPPVVLVPYPTPLPIPYPIPPGG
jgi:hypothetical protein